MRWSFNLTGSLLFLALSVPANVAHAELGGAMASVHADATRMAAGMASQTIGNYTRHELTRANGGKVHELTNADGAVFAVTWAGPGKPDLRSLLGRYFTTYQQSSVGGIGRTMHSLRQPPQVSESDLRIQTAGHMGWFRGIAFVPSLAPPGFSVSSLSQEP